MEYIGWCVKCKAKRTIKNQKAEEIRKHTWAVKGNCVICGTKMYKIIGKNKPEI